MEDERITLRMGSDEVRAMDSYLNEHPELGNRSLFIRTAVREYVNRDADVSARDPVNVAGRDVCNVLPDGRGLITMSLTKRQVDAIKAELEDLGMYENEGQLIKSLIASHFVTADKARQIAAEAYERTDQSVFKQ